jgi:hypothetical protein
MTRNKIAFVAGLPAALLLAACSSSGSPIATATNPPAATPAATTSAPPSTAATTSTSALTGTWAGQYSGSFNGTFTLNWTQKGSSLSGTIKLSDPDTTTPIHGSVDGGAIKFGTVGSTAITYSGSVSGTSMSGSYQVNSANGSVGGSWHAAKS